MLSNDVYMGGAGLEDVEMGQIKVFVQELGLKEGFLADTQIWIISLQSGLGSTMFVTWIAAVIGRIKSIAAAYESSSFGPVLF